jgi:hypothetical protein
MRADYLAVAVIAVGGMTLAIALALGWHRTSASQVAIVVAGTAALGLSFWRMSRPGALRRGILGRIQRFGGGTYGIAAFASLIYLESVSLLRDWNDAAGVGDLVDRHAMEWLIGFSGETIRNTISAAMWPFYWLQHGGALTAILVGSAAWTASRLLPMLASDADARAGGDC